MHKYDGNTVKGTKNDLSTCVNDTEGGEASSDVMCKINIDVHSTTMRKIENNQNSENTIDGKSDAISVNLSEFHIMSDNERIASRTSNDEQGVNFDGENNRRGELNFNTETYPSEEKEEQMYARARAPNIVPMTATVTTAAVTTAAAAVTTKDNTTEFEITHTSFKEFIRNDIMKDDTVPMMPMKSMDTMPIVPMKSLDMISRLKNDRIKCIQTAPNSGNAGSGSWTLRDNLMMKSSTGTGTGLLSPGKSNKHSTFAVLSGWTLKKQFKNVFSSQSVSSTSPTTGTPPPNISRLALLCLIMLYLDLPCTVLYCTVLYCTVLYCTVLYCTVLSYLLVSVCKRVGDVWYPVLMSQSNILFPSHPAIFRLIPSSFSSSPSCHHRVTRFSF